jgi:hypothetical protein
MNGYNLRSTTASLMILATTMFYLAAVITGGYELIATRLAIGEFEGWQSHFTAVALAMGRPAVGWVACMTLLAPLWAICREGTASSQQTQPAR